jgi:glycosyltransferase involved in cell wall biosynthesis
MLRVSILLPAYNEERTIADTIRSFHGVMPESEIWVINNNSSDNTEVIARQVIAELGVQGGVIIEPRKGKGNAVRRAFHEVDADIYLMSDADLTYPAERAWDLVAPIRDGRADMVVGDRHSAGHYTRENKRALHDAGNRLVQWLVNLLFGASLVDIMSGYRALSRDFVKCYPILVEGFEIETDMTLHALDKRFRIVEVPVEYRDRPAGSYSKLNTISDGAKVIFTIARILRYYRPMVFFGWIGILLVVAGLLAAVPVLDDWFRHRFIYHVPLAILATGLMVVAVVMVAIGLILDSITEQDKRNFERDLLNSKP